MYVWCIYIHIYIFNAQQCQACTAGSTGSDSHPRTTISRFLRWLFLRFVPGNERRNVSTRTTWVFEKNNGCLDKDIWWEGGKKGNARTIRFFLWFRPRQIPPTTRYDVCYNIKVRSSDLELKGASETLIGNRTFYDGFSTPVKRIPLLETIKRIRPFSVMRSNKSNVEDEITILVIVVKLILRVL